MICLRYSEQLSTYKGYFNNQAYVAFWITFVGALSYKVAVYFSWREPSLMNAEEIATLYIAYSVGYVFLGTILKMIQDKYKKHNDNNLA